MKRKSSKAKTKPAPPARIEISVYRCPGCGHTAPLKIDDVFPLEVK